MDKLMNFRAWDGSRMFYPQDGYYVSIFNHKQRVEACLYTIVNNILVSKTDRGLIILLSSGLRDKNDKEIYEGDVYRREGHTYIIIFVNGCFCVRSIKLKKGLSVVNILENHMFSTGHPPLLCNFLHGEVVGNIYESPKYIKN